MRIATLGTGGIGGYLAVPLTNAGYDVITIARGAHLQAIRETGLTLEAPGGATTVRPAMVTDDPVQVGPVDAIVFGVKGDALDVAAHAALPMIGPGTVVVPFLNGVEAANRLGRIVPEGAVGNGAAYVSTTIAAPGVIRQTGAFSRFVFGACDPEGAPAAKALRDAMVNAGIDAPEVPNVERVVWEKFVLFSAMSGVTAGGRCTLGDIRDSDALSATFRAVLAETAALGRARGIDLPVGLEEALWATTGEFPGTLRASTAIDLEAGRPLEVEWVSGAVVRLAREVGLDVPVNSTIYGLLSPHAAGRT